MKIGILGTGPRTGLHLWGYVRSIHVTAATLAAQASAARDALCRRYGLIRAVSDDPAAVLDDPDIALVHIAETLPDPSAAAESALAAGKHVLCERPPAADAAALDALYARAERAGRRLVCLAPHHYLPAVEKARELLAEDVIGAVRHVNAVVTAPLPAAEDQLPPLETLGGFLHDGYDLVEWLGHLLGDVKSVYALFRADETVGEDNGAAGKCWLLTLEGDRGTAQVTLLYGEDPLRLEIERRVWGDKGTVVVRDNTEDEMPLYVLQQGVFFPVKVPTPMDVYELGMDRAVGHALECIVSGKEPCSSSADVRRALDVCRAAVQSAAEGGKKTVDGADA